MEVVRIKSFRKKADHFISPDSSSKSKSKSKEIPFTVLEIERPVEPLPTKEAEEVKATPGEISADFTNQDCHLICQSFLQIPAVVWGKHLIRTDAQVQPFSQAFYNYCIRKGINPYDYFFDEFPLIIAGIALGKGMRDDHLKFKKEKQEKKDET